MLDTLVAFRRVGLKGQANQGEEFVSVFAQPAGGGFDVGAKFVDGFSEAGKGFSVGEAGFEGGGDDGFVGVGFGGFLFQFLGNTAGNGIVEAGEDGLQGPEFDLDVYGFGLGQGGLLNLNGKGVVVASDNGATDEIAGITADVERAI